MRYRKLALPILILMLTAITLPIVAQSDADVVTSFKAYVADYAASYKTDKRERVSKLGGGWAKIYYEPSTDYGIDVRRTDSLVSPYVGTLDFNLIEHLTAFHKTQAEAEADNSFIQTNPRKHRHTYAFQDGKWIPKSRQNYLAVLDKWYDCDRRFDGCWEEGAE